MLVKPILGDVTPHLLQHATGSWIHDSNSSSRDHSATANWHLQCIYNEQKLIMSQVLMMSLMTQQYMLLSGTTHQHICRTNSVMLHLRNSKKILITENHLSKWTVHQEDRTKAVWQIWGLCHTSVVSATGTNRSQRVLVLANMVDGEWFVGTFSRGRRASTMTKLHVTFQCTRSFRRSNMLQLSTVDQCTVLAMFRYKLQMLDISARPDGRTEVAGPK